MPLRVSPVVALCFCLTSCVGEAVFQLPAGLTPDSENRTEPESPAPGTEALDVRVPSISLRRLSRAEVSASISALTGISAPETFVLLPEDEGEPFDNDVGHQQASAVLVEAVDALAKGVAARAFETAAARAALIPCTPTGPADEACLRAFIVSFGRRALRRPLTGPEVTDLLFAQAFSVRANNFRAGVELVMRTLLQDVEFLYRVELGSPVEGQPGVVRLSGFELASRLSFFLWGRTPPDWLLDQAEQGLLSTSEGVRAAARRLLDDPLGGAQVQRFHSMWLGYAEMPHSAELGSALSTETRALLDQVIFREPGDYLGLFRSEQTWANDLLVKHYGLSALSAPGFRWVSYAGTARRGILSHGTLLSNGAKQVDTSPTRRGLWIRSALFCQNVPPPPPNVNADVPPASNSGSNCKKDRYAAHANVGSCAGCHRLMDPLGFGLENYDQEGRFRTHDVGDASCTIDGEGALEGIGSFNGPGGLSALLTSSSTLEPCVVRQVFRFASGRTEAPEDDGLLKKLTQSFTGSGRRFDALLLDLVSDETFTHRRAPEEG